MGPAHPENISMNSLPSISFSMAPFPSTGIKGAYPQPWITYFLSLSISSFTFNNCNPTIELQKIYINLFKTQNQNLSLIKHVIVEGNLD